jgi:hypothetical protein
MPALKEFANFVTLNTANLAETYAQLLAENGKGYEVFPVDRRMASARRLLKAVIESYESESSAPLIRIFDDSLDEDPRRWPKDINPPQPLQEVECLGHTLAPVVTNLESSKFLWQILSEVRAAVFQSMEKTPPPPASPKDRAQKETSPLETVEHEQVEEALERRTVQILPPA